MGVLSTKVAASVLATSVVVGGVMFTGGDTINTVKDQLDSLKNKVIQYETNEGSLLGKISLIKADATDKLTTANTIIQKAKSDINTLNAQKQLLEDEISSLQNEIIGLKKDVEKLTLDLNSTKDKLTAANLTIAEKEKMLADKEAELSRVNNELTTLEGTYNSLVAEYNALVTTSEANATEANRANSEITKANDKVAELKTKSEEIKTATDAAQPLTTEELNSISTVNQPDVFASELVVQKLNLTFVQNGNTDNFKNQHPDLNIQEGDRVWKVTNENSFEVHITYGLYGGENKTSIAKPGQSFYLTEQGGTMIIKWKNENDVWQQVTKAGDYNK
ncbi:hypothetical protein AWM68_13200 [Fictibacillus phosphorivorans]|uniref:Uncharacterized protein n=1 Tax=Fictibacillus phosphorivorans TaxID=1221500 RepID=A0A163PSG7_9BACL|nr:hypothetical protein [Fictibacillus phosphorivorans]KZE64058.1 hypothetical protein AWM68_13200 [Fictibacillus phosphorivorans]